MSYDHPPVEQPFLWQPVAVQKKKKKEQKDNEPDLVWHPQFTLSAPGKSLQNLAHTMRSFPASAGKKERR